MTPKRAAVLGLAMTWGLVATACGGGSGTPGVATLSGATGSANHTTTTVAPNPRNAIQLLHEWANCMRQHGIQMADPTVDGQGQISVSISGGGAGSLSKQTFSTGDSACSALHNKAIQALGGSQPTAKPDPTKLLAFARCMRAHGVPDFPDPNPNGGIEISRGPGGDLSPNNPAFQAAQQACQPLLGPLRGGMRVQVSGGGVTSGSSGATTGDKP